METVLKYLTITEDMADGEYWLQVFYACDGY
jgi:hypothetical protein